MKRIHTLFSIAFILLFLAAATGCEQNRNQDNPLEAVIYDNLYYASEEDLEGYMATMHAQSPQYAGTEKMMQKVFDIYDLKYEIKRLEILEQSNEEAKLEFVQITKKIKGPDFRNTKVTGIHILRRSKGQWKIYNTQVKNIEYMN